MPRFECERCGTTKTRQRHLRIPVAAGLRGMGAARRHHQRRLRHRTGRPRPGLHHLPLAQPPLAELGLSFDGYAAFGSLEQVAKVKDGVEERWQRTGKLPNNLGKLRTCLFFEQRASHHNGSPLDRPYTQALVRALRKGAASAGEVSHKGCFVCDPRGPGLQIIFERDESGDGTHAAFTIEKRWSTPDGYIPQAIVAAILDDCLTRAASTAARRRMRVEESKVEFHSQLRPGRPYTATGQMTVPGFLSHADASIQEHSGWPLASATATMVPGPLPASVFRQR